MKKESVCQQSVLGHGQKQGQQEGVRTGMYQRSYRPGRISSRPGHSRHHWELRLGRYAHSVAMMLLLACLCLLPLLFGGRHPFAMGVAGLTILAAGILWLAGVVFHGSVRLQPAWGVLFFLLFCLVGLMQLMPSFSSLVIGEKLLSYWELVRQAGVTYYKPVLAVLPPLHRDALLVFAMAGIMYFLLCQLFADSREHLVLLAMSIAGVATLCACLSMAQHFGGEQWFLWLYKPEVQSLSGPYFNKNHLGQLQEMGLFVSLGLLLSFATASRGSWLAVRFPKRRRYVLSCLAGFCFVACTAALVFTLSRAGILCAAAGLAIFLCVLFFSRSARSGKSFSLPVILLVVVLLLVSFYGLDVVTARLELALSGEDPSGLSRQEMWRTMREVIGLSPWWGTGFGSVRTLAPLFDLSYMPGFVTYDAHNDYLELAISLGIPCACLILAAVAFCLVKATRTLVLPRLRRSSLFPLQLGALVAIAVSLGHEFFDYGLKQPANLLVFLALVVVFAGLVRHSHATALHSDRDAGDGKCENKGHAEYAFGEKASVLHDLGKHVHGRHAFGSNSSRRGLRWQPGRMWYCLPLLLFVPAVAVGSLYAGRLATGVELMRLDILQKAPEVRRSLQPESLVTSLIRQADRVLTHDPENLAALNIQAGAHMQRAALLQTDFLADEMALLLDRPVSQEQVWRKPYRPYLTRAYTGIDRDDRFKVAAEYAAAAAIYARMAVANPLNGLTYAAMAHAVEEASVWRGGQISSLEMHRVALALYPTHVLVIRRALEGAWRAWEDESNKKVRQQLSNEALELAQLYSMQRQNMAWVYPLLWQMCPDRNILVAMADTSIRGQEYLAEFLMDKGFWQEALVALDQMEALNLARSDDESPRTMGIRAFLTREMRGKLPLERRILERKVAVLTYLGRPEQVALQQARLREVSLKENTPRLERVDSLMAEGQYQQAEEVLKSMPEDGRALARLAEILFIQGRYERLARVMIHVEELGTEKSSDWAALEKRVRARLGDDFLNNLRDRERSIRDLEQQAGQDTDK